MAVPLRIRQEAAGAVMGSVLALAAPVLAGDGEALQVANAHASSAPEGASVQPSGGGVVIDAKQRALWSLLKSIEQESGITFKVPGDLRKIPVTAVIKDTDWISALRKLLENFNKIEIFGDDGALQRVVIMRGDYSRDAPPFIGYGSEQPVQAASNAPPSTADASEGPSILSADVPADDMPDTVSSVERDQRPPATAVRAMDGRIRSAPPGMRRVTLGLGPPRSRGRAGAIDGPPSDDRGWLEEDGLTKPATY